MSYANNALERAAKVESGVPFWLSEAALAVLCDTSEPSRHRREIRAAESFDLPLESQSG
jgi:hypothetical protein